MDPDIQCYLLRQWTTTTGEVRMKGIRTLSTLTAIFLAALTVAAGCALAAEDSQSIGYEMKVQRASEAAIWAIPAVSIYDIELSIQRDLGGKFGDVVYFTKPMES